MADTEVARNSPDAYVYEIVVDGMVRYIGKGRGNRAHRHLRIAARLAEREAAGEKPRRSRFYKELARAIASGSIIEARVVASGLTDDEAFDQEWLAISRAPLAQLWNVAHGGEGQTTEFLTAYYSSPENRNLQRERALAAWARNPDRKSARFADPGSREKQRAMALEKWADPDYRAKQSSARAKPRPTRQGVPVPGLSAPAKARWADPQFKAVATEAIRKACGTPEHKAKLALIWTPERIARRAEAIREGLARRATVSA